MEERSRTLCIKEAEDTPCFEADNTLGIEDLSMAAENTYYYIAVTFEA
jgi:hypothetical protein